MTSVQETLTAIYELELVHRDLRNISVVIGTELSNIGSRIKKYPNIVDDPQLLTKVVFLSFQQRKYHLNFCNLILHPGMELSDKVNKFVSYETRTENECTCTMINIKIPDMEVKHHVNPYTKLFGKPQIRGNDKVVFYHFLFDEKTSEEDYQIAADVISKADHMIILFGEIALDSESKVIDEVLCKLTHLPKKSDNARLFKLTITPFFNESPSTPPLDNRSQFMKLRSVIVKYFGGKPHLDKVLI